MRYSENKSSRGYFIQEKSQRDKRASKIRLSEKGIKLYEKIDVILDKQSENLCHNGINDQSLTDTLRLLRKLDAFWNFIITHNIRG